MGGKGDSKLGASRPGRVCLWAVFLCQPLEGLAVLYSSKTREDDTLIISLGAEKVYISWDYM